MVDVLINDNCSGGDDAKKKKKVNNSNIQNVSCNNCTVDYL